MIQQQQKQQQQQQPWSLPLELSDQLVPKSSAEPKNYQFLTYHKHVQLLIDKHTVETTYNTCAKKI